MKKKPKSKNIKVIIGKESTKLNLKEIRKKANKAIK